MDCVMALAAVPAFETQVGTFFHSNELHTHLAPPRDLAAVASAIQKIAL